MAKKKPVVSAPKPPQAIPTTVTINRIRVASISVHRGVDWLQEPLNRLRDLAAREEPGTLASGRFSAWGCTALPELTMQDVGGWEQDSEGKRVALTPGGPVEVRPPQGDFRVRFTDPSEVVGRDRLMLAAERMRNYLAFVAQKPLSVVALIRSEKLLMPVRYESDPNLSAPPNDLHRSPELLQRWYAYLTGCYATTQRMLDNLPPESPVGRAVSLAGEAIWSADREERFFYAWRALEVVANEDLSRARGAYDKGDRSASSPYIDPHLRAYLDKQQVRLEADILVRQSIASRLKQANLEMMPQFYELRNAIAHGMITRRQHAAVVETVPMMLQFAIEVVNVEAGRTISLPVLPENTAAGQ